MKGYLKNPDATKEAFKGGYFHSGDLAVQHGDGYIQIADRAKDIIISGGENISSVEVESTLMGHDAVMLAAVVAKPDEKWGEVPCAFIELKLDSKLPKRLFFKSCPKPRPEKSRSSNCANSPQLSDTSTQSFIETLGANFLRKFEVWPTYSVFSNRQMFTEHVPSDVSASNTSTPIFSQPALT